MDDSVQCWSNPGIEYFKIWSSNSSNRARRFDIIHWINQLHFFDPEHGFHKKLWATTYLSLESYLPTSWCCWLGGFTKWGSEICSRCCSAPKFFEKSFLTRVAWISGWRSWLASRIQSCAWFLAFPHFMRWCTFWYIRDPRIGPLRIKCCDLPGVSQMSGGLSLRLSIPTERLDIPPRSRSGEIDWERRTAHCVLIQHLENLSHHSYFILSFLNSGREFKDRVFIFDWSFSRKIIDSWPLNSLQFFHLKKTFWMSFTKIQILFG